MNDFVHLHVHSEYSLLDGACRISESVLRAKEMGQKALAITDHGAMYGVYDFWKAAKDAGIKPIIGCEVYLAPRSRFDRTYDRDSEAEHLVLLCENGEGYKNLMKMVSLAWTEGFYIKPRVDMELIRSCSKGLICLSACIAGRIPRLILKGQYEKAKAFALELDGIFGRGNFFLEMQDHGIPEQKTVNAAILRLHAETGIPLVATNDAHYVKRENAELQDVLMCIQTVKKLDDKDRMRFESSEFYLKSGDEMAALFPSTPQALENTVKIADRCNVEFGFTGYIQPVFPLPEGWTDSAEYLRELCNRGFLRRYGENAPQKYRERLEYELSVIIGMGFPDYYLIVADYVNHAKEVGIPVGPGRGSGAGSIAAYCMGITDICPMKYDLPFERFLNPERVSMPDFDVDFCPKRRGEMIDYMVERYGADHVSQIITFGTMAARAVIRDVGRVLDVPYAEVDKIAKLIPNELHITIEKALEKTAPLRELYESDATVKRLIDLAKGLEGMPRNASTHAAGLVVTPRPTVEYVPLAKNDEAVVTQFPMNTVADLGLVKMDFLGLRNLTIIGDTVRQIKKRVPSFEIENIPDDDAETFKMLAEGRTCGVFQLESSGMTGVAVSLKAQSVEEISAVIALYRPGPMEQIPKYIEGKFHPERVTYRHPLLKDVLGITYGCPLYQEQVMEIFRSLGGYSLGHADIVRRAISKKKMSVLEHEKNSFIYGNEAEGVPGCPAKGIDEATARAIFEDIESFASYGFNKAHSAAYAMVSYQTAYLKCHYPGEYMGALLSSVLDNAGKVAEYSAECKAMGISVLPPNVNKSEDGFVVEDGNIRFGLVAIKNVGMKLILDLVAERNKNGPFTGFGDFITRMCEYDFNKRAAESLIRCGACDCFGLYRSQMMAMFEGLIESAVHAKASRIENQFMLFEEEELPQVTEPVPPRMEEFTRRDLLLMEKETAGIYLSGHPLDEYARDFEVSRTLPLSEIIGETNPEEDEYGEGLRGTMSYDGKIVTVGGIVTSVKQKSTKNSQLMAFVGFEDLTGSLEMLVFPKVLASFGGYIRADNAVVVKARVSIREGEDPKLICEECRPARPAKMVEEELAAEAQRHAAEPERNKRPEPDESNRTTVFDRPAPPRPAPPREENRKLFLRVEKEDPALFKRLKGLFQMFPGEMPVIIWVSSTNRRLSGGAENTVCADERFISELIRLLGQGSAIIK